MRVPRLVFFFFFFLLSGEMVLHCKQDIYFSVGLNTAFLLCSDIGLWWEGRKGCCSVRGRSSSNSLCQCAEEPPFSLYSGICDIRQPCQTSVHPFLNAASCWAPWASLVLHRVVTLKAEQRYPQKGKCWGLGLLMGQTACSKSQPNVICNCPFLLPPNLISSWLNLMVPRP